MLTVCHLICSHVLFRFIRLLQDDAERRKENLEKMQAASDRSTPEWLTRHVSKLKDVEKIRWQHTLYQKTKMSFVNMRNKNWNMV